LHSIARPKCIKKAVAASAALRTLLVQHIALLQIPSWVCGIASRQKGNGSAGEGDGASEGEERKGEGKGEDGQKERKAGLGLLLKS